MNYILVLISVLGLGKCRFLVEDVSRAHPRLPHIDGKVLLPLKLCEDMTVKLFVSTGPYVLFLSVAW